jgi:predicted dehydrogenase
MAPRSEKSTEAIPLSLPTDVMDDLRPVYEQFLDAVDGLAPLTITTAQALRVMKVMEASFVSARENRVVDVYI